MAPPLFGRRRRVVPQWAAHMSPDEYDSFLEHVKASLGKVGLALRLDEARGEADIGSGRIWVLVTLAQIYSRTPKDERARLVDANLGVIFDASNKPTAEQLADWEWVRPRLRVQLFDELSFRERADLAAAKSPCRGFIGVLAVDMPRSVETITKATARNLGPNTDELFAIGLSNVLEKEPWKAQSLDVGPGLALSVVTSESMFGASHALMLERHLSGPAMYGALVGVPTQHVTLFHEIRDAKVAVAVSDLIAVIRGFNRDGPRPVSQGLYWWRDGALTELPYRPIPEGVEFRPPLEFAQMMASLPKG